MVPATSTGLCLTAKLAGSLPRKLSSFQFLDGLTDLGGRPPPQFGQTLPSTRSTQSAQHVHSYEQIRASGEIGGSDVLQCSQVGLSSGLTSSVIVPCYGDGWSRSGWRRCYGLISTGCEIWPAGGRTHV